MTDTAAPEWVAVAALSAWFVLLGLYLEATVATGMSEVWYSLASLGSLAAITKRFSPGR
jgi:hypothetical protein